MRVLVLGGSGGVGRHTCRLVARWDAVDELVIADLDGVAAAELARRLGPRVRGFALDVTDRAALRAAMHDADIVMNTVGPFFRFGVAVLSAAIAAGCQYLDVCDDWEPTLQMLDLDRAARVAGVTAIVGMGASPGISNLLAVLAARELDSVDELITGWNVEAVNAAGETDGPSAAVVHGLRQLSGTILVVRGGELVAERPLRRTRVEYPGVGPRWTWTFGHPEPITLVRAVSGVMASANVVSARGPFIGLLKLFGSCLDRGVLTPRTAARLAAAAERHRTEARPRALFSPNRLPPLFGLATGARSGQRACAAVALTRFPGVSMEAVTGVPLAVALRLLATGSLAEPGVFTPEEAFDPYTFLEALGHHVSAGVADMTVVTRSWDLHAGRTYRAAMAGARAAAETQRRAHCRTGPETPLRPQ